MESHEPFDSSNTAALLRQLKPRVLSDFTELLQAHKLESSCLTPALPELFENLLVALQAEGKPEFFPPEAWVKLPLGQLISELSLLREVLSRFLPGQVPMNRMHRFLDRCLEAAVMTREHIEHEAQQRLYGFFQLVPTPVCVLTGAEKRITFANRAYETFVDREVQGKTLEEIFDPDELKHYSPFIEDVYQSGMPSFVNELPIPPSIGSSGKERWVDASYYPLGDVGTPIPGIIAVHYEVTDRVVNRTRRERSERRLRQTEEQLSRAIKVSKVGFFDWDLRQDLIHLNRQMRLDWGTEKDSLTADELEGMIHPDDRESTHAAVRSAIAQHIPYATHCRVIRLADQKVVWIEVQGEITYDDENRPLRFFGTSRNITERKEAELKLAAEKHKFEVIFHDSPAPMALWRGPEVVFELVNPQFENFFHAREFVGKTLMDALPELHDQPLLDLVRQVYETGRTYSASEFPTKIARYIGGPLEECYIDFSLTRVLDGEGKPYGVFVHAVNVSDKVKARDEARAASLSKSHFLANMSHEIRTPLAAILGFSALLRDSQLPESEREVFVDTIVRNGEALTRIIDDILDLAKVEAGRLEMEMLDFSLPSLIQDVLLLFKDRAQQKHLLLKADIMPNAPQRIATDPLRLRQILVNLVGNAVKFTNEGCVEVIARAVKQNVDWAITIEVKDTGIGLSPEQSSRLFQPFTQADHTTTRKFGGTGLGLALSQRLAEALGGYISIPFSEPGKGSTFCLQFSAHEASTQEEPPRKSPVAPMESYQLRGLRVLAVDDSPDNLFLVKNFLARSGAIVATASGGRHAIELAASHAFDIILLDIQMPEMDGYQAIQVLRERGFQKPIVALTAHAMVDERNHTQQAGFNAHLTKPLDALELVATVAQLAQPAPNAWLSHSNGLHS
jgi:PAS domain S-box-containing protein